MALQTKPDLQTLDVVGPLGVFCNVAAKGTETEFIGPLGPVFVLPHSTVLSDPPNVVYIKTGASTWSTATSVYIKTAALTWSAVDQFLIKEGATDWNGTSTSLSGSDLVFPAFQSAATSTDGAKVILTYSKTLSATTAATSAFAVVVDGSSSTVSSVATSGATVELTMQTAIQPSETVTVAYTDPSGSDDANAIQDSDGLDAISLSATSVTNNTAAPVFQSATTSGDGTKVILTYNQALSSTTAAASAFAVVVNSSAATITAVARGNNTSTIELTLSAAITTGQTVTVAYTDPTGSDDTNAVQGVTGIDCASFTATSVTVNLVNVALTAAEHYYDQGSSPNGDDVSRNMNSDSDANELWNDIPVVTTSGKRLFVIIATYRHGGGSQTHWNSHFNSSSLEVTLNLKYNSATTALTYRGSYAASEYNATSIWTAIADGANASTDDYTIQFIDSTSTSHGNFAYSGIVLDGVSNVEYVNIESLGFSETSGQNVTSALNLAPDNTTSASHVLRIAASNASNISSDVIDYNKGGSEPAYTQIGEGDNGTNERHHHAYYFGTHGTQVNMTGTFGDSSTGASNGISGLGCIIGLS
jgi:uncharacterized repeat protein (TIGR02059 family)